MGLLSPLIYFIYRLKQDNIIPKKYRAFQRIAILLKSNHLEMMAHFSGISCASIKQSIVDYFLPVDCLLALLECSACPPCTDRLLHAFTSIDDECIDFVSSYLRHLLCHIHAAKKYRNSPPPPVSGFNDRIFFYMLFVLTSLCKYLVRGTQVIGS